MILSTALPASKVKVASGYHTVEHYRANAEAVTKHLAHIPGFLFKLSHSADLGRLVGINETGGDFDHSGVNRRAPLLL